MEQPLQITFRDIPPSEALEADIREKATKLDQFYEKIMTCRVMVEAPQSPPGLPVSHQDRFDRARRGADR